MANKIRRLKITVRTKEMVVIKHGLDRETGDTEDTDFMVCPVCHAPMRSLPAADQQPVINVTAIEKKSDK